MSYDQEIPFEPPSPEPVHQLMDIARMFAITLLAVAGFAATGYAVYLSDNWQ